MVLAGPESTLGEVGHVLLTGHKHVPLGRLNPLSGFAVISLQFAFSEAHVAIRDETHFVLILKL